MVYDLPAIESSVWVAARARVSISFGDLFLLSEAFRGIIAAIPQHWLIGIQTFRILGGLFLIRYFQGDLPALFAVPAGVGDVLAGIFAPIVAYW